MRRLKPRKAVTAVLKRKDGYVLVYVLLVVILLGIFALTISSTALRNLKSQQNSIDQMQAQYEAEGQIELFWAKASEWVINSEADSDAVTICVNYKNYIENSAAKGNKYLQVLEVTDKQEKDDTFGLVIKVVGYSKDKSAAVEAVIYAQLGTFTGTESGKKYTLSSKVTLSYDSYKSVDPNTVKLPTGEGGTS